MGVAAESISIELGFSVSHDGMRKALELVYCFLIEPLFDMKAFDR